MIIEHPCTTCGYPLEKGVKLVAFADFVLGSLTIVACSTLISYFDELTAETNVTLSAEPSASTTESPTALVAGTTELISTWTTESPNGNDTRADLNSSEGLLTTTEMTLIPIPTSEQPNKPLRFIWKPKHRPPDYTLEWVLIVIVLFFAALQNVMVLMLYLGIKYRSIFSLYVWLIVAGFSIPATGFLIKMYFMIVVFAYSEEVKGEKNGQALEEFRKLPYICNIQTQLYPHPRYGIKLRPGGGKFGKRIHRDGDDDDEEENDDDDFSCGRGTFGGGSVRSTTAHFQNKSFVMNAPGALFSHVRHQ